MTARRRAWWGGGRGSGWCAGYLAGAVLLSCGTAWSHDARSVPRAVSSASAPTAAADPDRAGNRVGEGRVRPGRTAGSGSGSPEDADEAEEEVEEETDEDGGEAVDQEPTEDTESTEHTEHTDDGTTDSDAITVPDPDTPGETASAPSTAPGSAERPVTRAAQPATRVLRILPLGSGLVLIGLGLGLAFLALRLRRS